MSNLTQKARQLRTYQTDAESKLWHRIRSRQLNNYKFHRQYPIPPYIADFCCRGLNIIVELDGGQHNEESDRQRSAYLESKGYTIIRYRNHDILGNIEGVLEDLSRRLYEHACPHPSPLPEGEGTKTKKPSPPGRGLGEGL